MSYHKRILNFLNIIFFVCLFVILIIGIFLRTFALYHNENLFLDESFLVMNIVERNYLGLFLPLSKGQCCPPMFLILGKIIYSIFGIDNFCLKLLPFSFSVLAFLSFSVLSFKVIKNRLGIFFAVLSFSLSEWCILYQMYFKQYISDVFFTTVVLLLAILLKDKKLSNIELFLFGILSCFLVFCSYPAGFLIFCVIIAFCNKNLEKYKNKQENIKPFLCYIIPFSLIMTVYFFMNCLPEINSEFLQEFWNQEYKNLFFVPKNYTQVTTVISFLASPFSKILPSLVLFILMFFILKKKDKFLWGILYLPFVTAFTLGYFNLYPFAPERVSLYLIPIFTLILFKPLDFLSSKNKILSTILLLLVFLNVNYKKVYNYYIKIFNGDSISIIDEYRERYTKEKVTLFPQFLEILEHSDITPNDYFIRDYAAFFPFDDIKNDKINNDNMRLDIYGIFTELYAIPKNSNIYFYISEEHHFDYKKLKEWINKNCIIIYNVECYNAEFIKCKKSDKTNKGENK